MADGRLSPCPFCGRAPRWMSTAGPQPWYWVYCVCGIALSVQMTPEAAIAAWNTRAWPSPAPPPSSPSPPPWPPEARHYITLDAPSPRPACGIVIPHGPAAAVLRVITREWQATSVIAASAGLSTPVTCDALHGLAVIGTVLRRFWCEHDTACGGCIACFTNPLRHEWRR